MRTAHWQTAGDEVFDVLVLGGGITGASLYAELCRQGWRTLLIDKGDFASGTSQSSGMMVWGGLLYLRAGDVLTVLRLSRSRDRMIEEPDGWTTPTSFHYIPSLKGDRRRCSSARAWDFTGCSAPGAGSFQGTGGTSRRLHCSANTFTGGPSATRRPC